MGDHNLLASYEGLKGSQHTIEDKIDGTLIRYSKIEADLARVETLMSIESTDRFTGKDGKILTSRIDNLDAQVEEIDKRTKK